MTPNHTSFLLHFHLAQAALYHSQSLSVKLSVELTHFLKTLNTRVDIIQGELHQPYSLSVTFLSLFMYNSRIEYLNPVKE